jgi:hypothetical protein
VPNVDDFLWKLVQVCFEVGAYPADNINLWLPVADAEEVATCILESALGHGGPSRGNAVVDVETGLALADFWELVQDAVGNRWTPMSVRQWTAAVERYLQTADRSHAFRPLFAMIQGSKLGLLGGPKPSGAKGIRHEVVRKNVQTLMDIGFLSCRNAGAEKELGAFSRSHMGTNGFR